MFLNLYQFQKSYKDATTAKDCLQEQVVKLDQGLQDSAIIISHNEKQVCTSLLTK
jgi:hypothetical protein